MSQSGRNTAVTAKAAGDLSGARYHFVRLSAADTVNISSHANATDAAGVLIQTAAAAGRHVSYVPGGTGEEVKITAGAAITVNQQLTCNGSGRAIAATSGTMIMGRALEAATQDGDVIMMVNVPFYHSGGNVN